MKRITVFVDHGPHEGLPFDCGAWEVGRAGELRIYNDDAAPGQTIRGGFATPPIVLPPKPPTLKAVYANGKWSCVMEAE